MTNYRSLNHTKWACQYHVVFIPKYRKKAIYGELRRYLGDVLRRLARHREFAVAQLCRAALLDSWLLPVELGVAGLIDLTHAAFADLGGDGVGAEAGADAQGHGCSQDSRN